MEPYPPYRAGLTATPRFDSSGASSPKRQEIRKIRFELRRATAAFGVFHPRDEKNKGNACDIPFSVTVGAEILEMLLPAQREDGDKTSPDAFVNELFSVEGYVRRPAITPITIHRKPEGATVTIWDKEDFDRPLVLNPCSLRKLTATLNSPHQVVLTGQIQYSQYNDNELVRINALMNKNFDLAIVIEQTDMFEGEGDDDGGEENEDGDLDDRNDE